MEEVNVWVWQGYISSLLWRQGAGAKFLKSCNAVIRVLYLLDLEWEEQGLDPVKQTQKYLLHRLSPASKARMGKYFASLKRREMNLVRQETQVSTTDSSKATYSRAQSPDHPRMRITCSLTWRHLCPRETTRRVCKDPGLLHTVSFVLGSFLS